MSKIGAVAVIGCVVAASAGMLMAEEGTTRAETKDFVQKQKAENREFRTELKEKTVTEKAEAMDDQLAKQHAENVAFLKEKLANSKLTDEQKEEIVSFVEKQYGERIAFRDERLKDFIAEIEKLSNDDTLSMEQKKAAMKEYITKKKAEAKAMREQQRTERKAEREKIKAERKAGAKE